MIFLATPISESSVGRRNFIDSIDDTKRFMYETGYTVLTEFYQGPYICANRNRAMFDCYANKAQWLVFIDNDMIFKPDDVEKLIRNEGEVITGIYKTGEGKYCLYDYNDEKNEITAIDSLKNTVDIAGTGFMAIKNTVIEKMCNEDFRNTKWTKTSVRNVTLDFPFNMATAKDCVQFGEDASFCLRLRELDIPIHVARNVELGHEKLIILR